MDAKTEPGDEVALPGAPGSAAERNAVYWDALAELYQRENRISVEAFHYGPLLGSDAAFGLLPSAEALAREAGAEGMACLELGCGAGQNSIVLARRGARCVAVDVSEAQLAYGRTLAESAGVEVDFRCGDMAEVGANAPVLSGDGFGLIHSTYALPFAEDPATVVASAAAALAPGGTLLVTTGHPLYMHEWLEIEEDETGMFVQDYFSPLADIRLINSGEAATRAVAAPVSEVVSWFTDAGLVVDRLLEPRPLPVDRVRAEAPYWSEDWLKQHGELSRIPLVLVIRGRKLDA